MQRPSWILSIPRFIQKHTLPPGGSTAAQQVMRQVVQAPPGPQTLLQPDIPKPVTLAEKIPVPQS